MDHDDNKVAFTHHSCWHVTTQQLHLERFEQRTELELLACALDKHTEHRKIEEGVQQRREAQNRGLQSYNRELKREP